MKLHISFDLTNLENALSIAEQVKEFAAGFDVGALLLYNYGVDAIKQFKKQFSDKVLTVDAKIVSQGKESVTLLIEAGAEWVTVMAGTRKEVIHAACTKAHTMGAKVMLDVTDANSYGQSALEAQSLGADALLFRADLIETEPLLFKDQWAMIRGNTSLPIYLSGRISLAMMDTILEVKPDGIFVGRAITHADDPKAAAKLIYEKL